MLLRTCCFPLQVPLLSWGGLMPANDPEVDLEVERGQLTNALFSRHLTAIFVTPPQVLLLSWGGGMAANDPVTHHQACRTFNHNDCVLPQVPLLSWDGVMPANDPEVDLEVERLNGRPKGVIKVHVIQAKELKAYDTLGE